MGLSFPADALIWQQLLPQALVRAGFGGKSGRGLGLTESMMADRILPCPLPASLACGEVAALDMVLLSQKKEEAGWVLGRAGEKERIFAPLLFTPSHSRYPTPGLPQEVNGVSSFPLSCVKENSRLCGPLWTGIFGSTASCGLLIKGIGHRVSSGVLSCGSIGSGHHWEGFWQQSKDMA